MYDKLVQEIKVAIDNGNTKKANLKLTHLLKKGPFSSVQKYTLSQLLLQCGQSDKAIKIVGREATDEEMMQMDLSELKLQLQLAYLMNWVGAKYSCSRLCKKVNHVINERDLKSQLDNSDYYYYESIILRTNFEAKKSLALAKRFHKIKTLPHKNQVDAQLNLADCYLNLNKLEEASTCLSITPNDANKNFSAKQRSIYWRIKSQIFKLQKDYVNALTTINLALKDYAPSIESAVALREKGEIYFFINNFDQAKKYFVKSLQIALNINIPPQITLAILWSVEKIPNFRPPIGHLIALRCHPIDSTYSFLVGKLYKPGSHKYLHPFFENKIKEKELKGASNDCWIIKDNQISPAQYKNIITEVVASYKQITDLHGGILFKEGKLQSMISMIHLRCLSTIIGGGTIGVNKWIMIDTLYRAERFRFKYGQDRLKANIVQLKRQGFSITRIGNNYYFDLDYLKDNVVILSMSFPKGYPEDYLRAISIQFKRSDVEKIFNVHKSTANRWIKTWIDNFLVESTKENYYHFIK